MLLSARCSRPPAFPAHPDATFAALLGAVLLAVAGPGWELRRPLGIAIFGGLPVSQMGSLYTRPIINVLRAKVHHHLRGSSVPVGRRAPAQ